MDYLGCLLCIQSLCYLHPVVVLIVGDGTTASQDPDNIGDEGSPCGLWPMSDFIRLGLYLIRGE